MARFTKTATTVVETASGVGGGVGGQQSVEWVEPEPGMFAGLTSAGEAFSIDLHAGLYRVRCLVNNGKTIGTANTLRGAMMVAESHQQFADEFAARMTGPALGWLEQAISLLRQAEPIVRIAGWTAQDPSLDSKLIQLADAMAAAAGLIRTRRPSTTPPVGGPQATASQSPEPAREAPGRSVEGGGSCCGGNGTTAHAASTGGR